MGEVPALDESRLMKIRLDAIEAKVEQRNDPEALSRELREILSDLPFDSEYRPQALRLSGVVKNRRRFYRSALAELSDAKAVATARQNLSELAKISREISVLHAWRGDDRAAALELLHSLALFSVGQDRNEIAKTFMELCRIELEARRFDQAAMLLQTFAITAAQDLTPKEVLRMTISLCQALNRLGRHAEVLSRISKLDRELSKADTRLRFLAQLEEGRALSGLGRIEEAGDTLGRAKKLISHTETDAFERAEQKEAEAELKLLKGDLSAIEDLKEVANKFVDQDLVVRATNVHLALAEAMFKLGQVQVAYEILSSSLIGALRSNLVEVADRIRADMIKNAKTGQLEELTETIELIGGAS